MCCNSIRMVMVIYNRVLKSTGRCFFKHSIALNFRELPRASIAPLQMRVRFRIIHKLELADHTQHEFPSNEILAIWARIVAKAPFSIGLFVSIDLFNIHLHQFVAWASIPPSSNFPTSWARSVSNSPSRFFSGIDA